jgi:single-stranded-DNA-specific exonuclease
MPPREIRRRDGTAAPLTLAGLHPVLRRVYAARGVATPLHLDLSLDRLLPISSLESVGEAALLLAEHRSAGKRVIVVGDFDADGATSSALVVRALRSLKFAAVEYLVPNRFTYGYGLTPEIVALAAERQPTLLMTVDNGVSSVAGVAAARGLGMQVLITDHHLAGAELPAADVIVNPNLPGSAFGSRALAGVGVAFYVIAALARRLAVPEFRLTDLLDLVALGTVADMVPLDTNNRVLVAQGLKRIRAGRTVPGIRALLAAAGRRLDAVSAADLGFAVAPRLNAAGRLTDMSLGIECLLTDDVAIATRTAGELSRLNFERRDIEQRMQREALDIVAHLQPEQTPGAVVLFDESWHQGVVGLVAGRIKDRVHRPVVAFARAADGFLRGSARSVPGVHIRDVFDSVAAHHPGLIEKFGGHAMAAGLTLAEAQLQPFRAAFDHEVRLLQHEGNLSAYLLSDGPLAAEELSLTTALALREGGPWGQGFPEPLFDGQFRVTESRIVGDKHLKLRLRATADGPDLDAIAFGYFGGPDAEPTVPVNMPVKVAYRLEVNEWNGRERPQLNCEFLGAATLDETL